MQTQTGNMLFVARNHFQSPAAGMIENGPDRRHGLGQQEGQAAQRIDVFLNLGQAAVDRISHIVQLGPGIGFPHPVFEAS